MSGILQCWAIHIFLFPEISVIRFYTECFGMKVLRKRDVPDEKYANAFLGFGPEDSHFVMELTYSMFSYFCYLETMYALHFYLLSCQCIPCPNLNLLQLMLFFM